MEIVTKGTLHAPAGFWKLSPDHKKHICNGVGAESFSKYVPDAIFGLNIRDEADVHDYMYFEKYDQKESDQLFYDNVYRKIAARGGVEKYARMAVLKLYYGLLVMFGRFFY
jgi:hypothetical protein